MVIRFNTQVLADGDRGDAVAGLTLNGQRVIQEEAAPGSTTVTLFPRGNRAVTVSFQVTRLHASLTEAVRYLFEHGDSLEDRGLLRILSTGSGGARLERYMTSACLADYEHRNMGCTTFHRYTFRGAAITKTSPKTA